MGRKNNRAETGDPLELSSAEVYVDPLPRTYRRRETPDERDARVNAEFGRRRARNDERMDQRVTAAITDQHHCCIPGPGEKTAAWRSWRREAAPVSEYLPLCPRHETIVAKQAEDTWNHPDVVAMREKLARQQVTREVQREERLDILGESGGAKQGQIYFVRLNGLIKVGWSLRLRTRLKAYGASAQILCHYPASRADETHLHRQLRPYLAMGREWYQDCKLLNDVIAQAVKQYGEPSIYPYWTVPKPDLSARPKGYPAA